MISVEDAIQQVLAAVTPHAPVQLPLHEAAGLWAAQDILSPVNLPLFDNSAMDGYAVRAADLANVSTGQSVHLKIRERIAAGDAALSGIGPGECARLFTGSKVPAGADSVVMQEDVTAEGETVTFFESVKPLENVRLAGEDVRKGTVLVQKGRKLEPARIGLLAATGVAAVSVYQPCRVGLLATGNELRETGAALKDGEIYESNRAMISPLIEQFAAKPRSWPIVRDTLVETTQALEQAFAADDIVISTGGVSVGELDFVKEALSRLGGTIELWRVAMRPGKPFVLGRLRGKLLFGLPGNPVSAFVTFLLFVRPAILKMQGAADLQLPIVEGKLVDPVANRGDRRQFARVRWCAGEVKLTGPQKSHMLGSLADANALLDMPPQSEFAAGCSVQVRLWSLET